MGSDIRQDVEAIVVSIDDHDRQQCIRKELLCLLSVLDLKFETVMNHAKDTHTSQNGSSGPRPAFSLTNEKHNRRQTKRKQLKNKKNNKCIMIFDNEEEDDHGSFHSLDSNKIRSCRIKRVNES